MKYLRFHWKDLFIIPLLFLISFIVLSDLTPPFISKEIRVKEVSRDSFVLEWTYSRIFPQSIDGVERYLYCDNGNVRFPKPIVDEDNTSTWPPGFNKRASIRLSRPDGAEGVCYYTGYIHRLRFVFPDYTDKTPAVPLKVEFPND